MKYILLALLLPVLAALQSCMNKSKVAYKVNDAVKQSGAQKVEYSLDSAFYYFKKEIDSKSKRDELEIKYLRTGKDIYRIKGNLYADSIHYYYLLLHAQSKK